MVRNGDKLDGVVSFHGVLQVIRSLSPLNYQKASIVARLLVKKASDENFNSNIKILIENGTLDEEAGPKAQALFWHDGDTQCRGCTISQSFRGRARICTCSECIISTKISRDDRHSLCSMLLLFVRLHGGPEYMHNEKQIH